MQCSCSSAVLRCYVMSNTYDQGKGLTELVGTVGRSGSVGTGQLVQHPRGGSVQALKVVLWASNHCEMRNDAMQRRVSKGLSSLSVQRYDQVW